MITLTRQEAVSQRAPIIRRGLHWQGVLSAVIAGLMAFASLGPMSWTTRSLLAATRSSP
jgi:hypothetical protein